MFVGYLAVYRVCFSLAAFFFFFMVLIFSHTKKWTMSPLA